ncbi:MAG: hypothetical protein WBN22_01355 [Verrucomicrobiia bacterium]
MSSSGSANFRAVHPDVERVTPVITRPVVGGAQETTVVTVPGLRQKSDLEVYLLSGPTTGPEGSLESEFKDVPRWPISSSGLVHPIHPWNDALAFFGDAGRLLAGWPGSPVPSLLASKQQTVA